MEAEAGAEAGGGGDADGAPAAKRSKSGEADEEVKVEVKAEEAKVEAGAGKAEGDKQPTEGERAKALSLFGEVKKVEVAEEAEVDEEAWLESELKKLGAIRLPQHATEEQRRAAALMHLLASSYQMRISISGLYDRHEPRDEPPAPLPPLVAPPLVAPPLSASLLLPPTVANLSVEAAKVS